VTADEAALYVMMNMTYVAQDVRLPPGRSRGWRRIVDTSLPAPADFVQPEDAKPIDTSTYRLAEFAVAIFEA